MPPEIAPCAKKEGIGLSAGGHLVKSIVPPVCHDWPHSATNQVIPMKVARDEQLELLIHAYKFAIL